MIDRMTNAREMSLITRQPEKRNSYLLSLFFKFFLIREGHSTFPSKLLAKPTSHTLFLPFPYIKRAPDGNILWPQDILIFCALPSRADCIWIDLMMRRRTATVTLDPSMSLRVGSDEPRQSHGPVVGEIEGLIRVFKDGFVERPRIVPCVSSSLSPRIGVASQDTVIDRFTNVWARFYVPTSQGRHKFGNNKLPLVVYFHGGGFCVGSPAWSCYHDFLARLALKANVCVLSVNYRLAPENPLPAAYEDGMLVLKWLKQQAILSRNSPSTEQRIRRCDFSRVFLAGDSAGANIAHNLAARLASNNAFEAMSMRPLGFKGTILVQPFFGGEERTESEKGPARLSQSLLSLATADTYWRLALPSGADQDHHWCNPITAYKKGSARYNLEDSMLFPTLVCISGKDILRDRNLQFCRALAAAGKVVEHVVFEGVGHAFQILSKSEVSQARREEMMSHITSFINREIRHTSMYIDDPV